LSQVNPKENDVTIRGNVQAKKQQEEAKAVAARTKRTGGPRKMTLQEEMMAAALQEGATTASAEPSSRAVDISSIVRRPRDSTKADETVFLGLGATSPTSEATAAAASLIQEI